MTHNNILTAFTDKFGEMSCLITAWFPSGKDCVRIRFADKNEIMFTYHSDKDWCLESVNSYISKMKRRI